ncbi:hypothetical protein [Streptomyces sp. NPDC102283]|uniref:hypothetical protein n=1 Tax=Streptomyces sp. NPDC102283 TaxID=3366155 RepID=UPI00381EAC46
MSEHGFDVPPKAPPEVIGRRDALAEAARLALVRAGIPAHRAELGEGPAGRPGADVQVDPLADGGVLVEWNTREELATEAVNLLESGVDPSNLPHTIRHYESVQTCMRDALSSILASAGFQVERADEHTFGSAVRVTGFTP